MSVAPRILLADADAFFAAVARQVDPEGAGKARYLIVGGTRESRGVVCSASWEARQFGVRSAMSIAQALRLCPQAMCVPVPMKACGVKSQEIREVLKKHAPVVEGASIDEWYMDLSGTERLYKHEHLSVTAHRIRAAVRNETGMGVSIGGGINKLVAKLAVERAKPKPNTQADGVHIVAPGMEAEFLQTFTLAELPMVGPKFQEKLARLGMTTVPHALQYDRETLQEWLGDRAGAWLWNRVRGQYEAHVEGRGKAKSMSRDGTFPKDLHSDLELEQHLVRLVTRAANDLRGDGLTARTVTVKLRDHDFKTRSAQQTMPTAVVSDRVILEAARALLLKLRQTRRVPARLLGVSLSGLEPDPMADQLALFEAKGPLHESDRDRSLARAVDRVREKYGDKGILPASLSRPEVR
ncbi:MAG: DNA polymerase IV [Gemmatimonadota bacterium]